MKRIAGLVAMLVVAGACSGNGSSTTSTLATGCCAETTTAGAAGQAAPTGTQGTVPVADGCAPLTDGVPWTDEITAEAVTLQEPGPETPGVLAVVYPHPDYEGRPWSQWGQGFALADGRFLSAIGDHGGADGNSYLYEYDPEAGVLTQIADVLSLVDHTPGRLGLRQDPRPDGGRTVRRRVHVDVLGVAAGSRLRGQLHRRLPAAHRSADPTDRRSGCTRRAAGVGVDGVVARRRAALRRGRRPLRTEDRRVRGPRRRHRRHRLQRRQRRARRLPGHRRRRRRRRLDHVGRHVARPLRPGIQHPRAHRCHHAGRRRCGR